MKRIILSLILGIMSIASSFAMSIAEARQQAYFLTDKMAYELDLTPSQYEQVFQVNMEYFLNVDRRDPYGFYWDYRNADLSYILFDWQYNRYRRASYFLRPIVWRSGAWYFPIVERYAHTYYFFARPTIWDTWRGGIWSGRVHNTPSPFIGHRPNIHNGGMRHNLKPGDHHGGNPGGKPHNGGSYYNGGNNRPNNGGSYYNGGNNRPSNNGYNGNNGSNRPSNNGGYNGSNRPNNGGYNGNNGNNRPNNGGYNGNNGINRGGNGMGTGSRGGNSMTSGNRTTSGSTNSSSNGGRSFGNGGRR